MTLWAYLPQHHVLVARAYQPTENNDIEPDKNTTKLRLTNINDNGANGKRAQHTYTQWCINDDNDWKADLNFYGDILSETHNN